VRQSFLQQLAGHVESARSVRESAQAGLDDLDTPPPLS
jgi:hypothetical protein